jgi:hypothetical protein
MLKKYAKKRPVTVEKMNEAIAKAAGDRFRRAVRR